MATETLMTATPEAAPDATAAAANASAAPAPVAADAVAPVEGVAPAKAEAPVVGAPEKYEAFKVAENALTAEDLARVEADARALNLPQDAAQKLAELRASDKATSAQATQKMMADARSEWVASISGDKELGGDKLPATLATAKKALQSVDPSGEVSRLLSETGFGDHPAVIRMFHRLGLSTLEDSVVSATGAPNGARSTAEILYPTKQQGA